MRILIFIGGLRTGGSERQIALLGDGLSQLGHDVNVATMYPEGQYWRWIESRRTAKVVSLFGKKYKFKFITGFQMIWAPVKLRKLICTQKADMVYSVLNLSNLIAWFSVQGIKRKNLVWGSRASETTLSWKDALPFQICSYLSPTVPLLIANSRAGLTFFEEKGYRAKTHMVIPNGIDTNHFKFDPARRQKIRLEWGVEDSQSLIGLIGRLDPMKDHSNFLEAAAKIVRKRSDVVFVCVGEGKTLEYLTQLHRLARELGLDGKVIWSGNRTDMADVYSALDIATSASAYGEGFSNCIGEAMACGLPCVVTDVGDSAKIVGNAGIVTMPKDPKRLAEAWLQVMVLDEKERRQMGRKARARIQRHYSVASMLAATEQSLFQVLGQHAVTKKSGLPLPKN